LPFLRQQAGRAASASGASSGAISIQLKIISSESAIERRIVEQYSLRPDENGVNSFLIV